MMLTSDVILLTRDVMLLTRDVTLLARDVMLLTRDHQGRAGFGVRTSLHAEANHVPRFRTRPRCCRSHGPVARLSLPTHAEAGGAMEAEGLYEERCGGQGRRTPHTKEGMQSDVGGQEALWGARPSPPC